MKKVLSTTFSLFFLLIVSLGVTSCNVKDIPKVQNVGKCFDNLKQISGNLFYDTNNDNMVYTVTYNSIGDKTVKPFEKEGKYYTYDAFSNEVVFLNYSNKYNYSGTNLSGLTETTAESVATTEPTTLEVPTISSTTEPAPITIPATEATTRKEVKKTKPKTTTKKQTQRRYTTRRVYTTKKKAKKTTKRPNTTKKMKIFKFDGKKYYINDSGKWIKVD